MNTLCEAAQQALEALEANQYAVADQAPHGDVMAYNAAITALRAALAQQDEPLNLRDPAVQKRLAAQWGYVPAAAQAEPVQEPVAYTTGHCENHKQKGGCQLHNLQCGWPDCDRKPTTAPPQQAGPVEPVNVGLLEYRGNSVAFIHQKMTAYRAGIDAAWDALRAKGLHPDGKTSLANMIAKHTAPPQRKPLTEEEIERIGMKHVTLREVIRAVERAHGIKE